MLLKVLPMLLFFSKYECLLSIFDFTLERSVLVETWGAKIRVYKLFTKKAPVCYIDSSK